MTYVDTADLQDRTCRRCGCVYGDALLHRRWHGEQEATFASVERMLRSLFEATELLHERTDGEP